MRCPFTTLFLSPHQLLAATWPFLAPGDVRQVFLVRRSDRVPGPTHLLSRTHHSSARSHRPEDFVAQIEVVEESRGCMHAGNPEDCVAEGVVYFHDQLPQSTRLCDRGADVETGKGDGNPLEPGTEHRRCWNRDEERIKRELDDLRGRSHPSRHRLLRRRAIAQPP